jgi:hypothetical protein
MAIDLRPLPTQISIVPKKRVIVYAMRFDESEDTTVLLRQIREIGHEVFASEAKEVIRNRRTLRE